MAEVQDTTDRPAEPVARPHCGKTDHFQKMCPLTVSTPVAATAGRGLTGNQGSRVNDCAGILYPPAKGAQDRSLQHEVILL